MHILLQRGVDDLRRREPDTLVNHLHSAISGPHGDLLRAIGMAVEPGLADQELEPAAKLARDRVDSLAHRRELARIGARRLPHAGGRAVFAKDLAQRGPPFAGGHASLRRRDGRLHDVAPLSGRAPEIPERLGHGRVVAGLAPGGKAGDRFPLDVFGNGEDAAVLTRRQR